MRSQRPWQCSAKCAIVPLHGHTSMSATVVGRVSRKDEKMKGPEEEKRESVEKRVEIEYVPDFNARHAWLQVCMRLGVLPRELAMMINKLICMEMVNCQWPWCTRAFRRERVKFNGYCSRECEERSLSYPTSGQPVWVAHDLFTHGPDPRTVRWQPLPDVKITPFRGCKPCKVCKRAVEREFKDGYCGRACFKKRWK